QDELRPVDDLEIGLGRDAARLGRRELAVEDHRLRVEIDAAHHDFVELALPDHPTGIGAVAELDHGVYDLDPRRARQTLELGEPRARAGQGAGTALVTHVNEDGAAVLGHAPRPTALRELRLERADELPEVRLRVAIRHG